MKDKIIVAVLIIIVALIMIYSDVGSNRVVVYDCRIAEISPDFPIKAREECRKLRMEHIPTEKDTI